MKRVHLHSEGDYRRAAVALAKFAVNGDSGRVSGDPVHEWVTEGRRTQYERALANGAAWAQRMRAGYSSCGDLAHWLLMCLGCRYELVVNRGDDGGVKGWAIGANIGRLAWSSWYEHASENGLPIEGDILHVAPPDHVSVLIDASDPDSWATADYGQPHGRMRECPLRDVSQGLLVRGRKLEGWVSIGRMVKLGALIADAIVPDDFDGDECDNPYVDVEIPEGI
jgi:hypothetical protein